MYKWVARRTHPFVNCNPQLCRAFRTLGLGLEIQLAALGIPMSTSPKQPDRHALADLMEPVANGEAPNTISVGGALWKPG